MQTFTKLLNNVIFFSLFLVIVSSSYAGNLGQVTHGSTGEPDYCIIVETEDQTIKSKKCRPLRVTNGKLTDNGSYFSLDISAGGGTMTTVKSGGSQVGDADITTLDFDSGPFTATESPDKEINIDVKADGIDDTHIDFGTGANQVSAADIPIALGGGTPTVDQIQEYLDNTGSPGFFLGGAISDGGSGTVNVAAGSGFIRTTPDDNVELQSFKWSASSGIAVPDDTTQYIYVDDSGVISLSTNEFLEAADKIKIGVVTDEGASTIHAFSLGVRLQDSIGSAGRFIRHVHGIERNKRFGGLIFGQSGDSDRDVTMTAGQLEWGRTSYTIGAFNTGGANTFATYSANGSENATASQWPNEQYDSSGTLTSVPNNKYANLFFFLEPDDHLIMIYGRSFFNSEALADEEDVPSTSLPSRVSETSILVARFTFKESVNTAVISSAFEQLFANASTSDHTTLANIAWTSSGHTGTANTIPSFDGTGAAAEISDSAGLLGALDDETGSGLAVFGTSPTLTSPNLASVKKRVYMSTTAGTCRTTTGCTDAVQNESSTNKVNYWTTAFADDADDHQQWEFTLPENYVDGSTFTYAYEWYPDSDTTGGGVSFFCQMMSITDNDVIDTAFGTAIEVSDDWIASTDFHRSAESGAVTSSGSPIGGDKLFIQCYRDVDDADDDLSGGAADAMNLGGIWLTFGIDQLSTED